MLCLNTTSLKTALPSLRGKITQQLPGAAGDLSTYTSVHNCCTSTKAPAPRESQMSNCSTPASLHQVGFAPQTQSPGRWRDLRLCSQWSARLQMLSVPQTQPCNVTSSSASWLLSPKVSQPTAEVCIYHTKRGIKKKGLSSAPQTGKNQVSSAAVYSLRFIKLSFVPNFKTPPNQDS